LGEKSYFPGERTIDSFAVAFNDGKTTLICSVNEQWEEEIGGTLRCGNEHTYSVTRRFGISTTDREELEATITGSLGLKGIAELRSQVKGKVGRELRLEEGQETKKEFKLKAPECGRLSLCVYKLIRLYRFRYEDNRLWRKERWEMTIAEGTNHIDDKSIKQIYDPACGCDPPGESRINERVRLVSDNINMLVDCAQTQNGVEIPMLRTIVATSSIENMMFADFTFDSELLPPYLLFLAGVSEQSLTGQLRPVEEEPVHKTSFTSEQLAVQRSTDLLPVQQTSSDAIEKLTFLLIGGGIGTTLALLFAPKSGREMRGEIVDYAKRSVDAAGERARLVGDRVTEVYGSALERIAAGPESVTEVAARQKEQIAAAIEAGKQAYREDKRKADEQSG
jgi:gas vesicle protein